MALVEFGEVVQRPLDGERLRGFFLDHPRPGMRGEASAVDVWGWVIGRHVPAVAAEIVHEGRVIRRAPVNVHRPDVLAAYPDAAGAEFSGFCTTVRMLGVAEAELSVRAVLKDQSRVELASMRARARWRGDDCDLPLVSVVIPCFNHARYLSEAIESVLAQSYPHLEVVVVDDGSSDNTSEVAGRYPGVRLVRQPNQGRCAARNTGIRQTNGDYLVFLDADDRLLPSCVEAGLDCFRRNPDAAFVSGRFRWIAHDGTVLYRNQGHTIERDHYREMLRRNYIPMGATVVYRRSVFESVGGFDTSRELAEDCELYFRITRSFPVACHDGAVAEYRRHASNSSQQSAIMLRASLDALRTQRKYVRGDRGLADAYRSGLRFWKSLYAETALEQLRAHVRDRDWSRALRCVGLLLRFHPTSLAALVGVGPFSGVKRRREPAAPGAAGRPS
jgi:glycosyltransferase involved in cell wall biosynthesis